MHEQPKTVESYLYIRIKTWTNYKGERSFFPLTGSKNVHDNKILQKLWNDLQKDKEKMACLGSCEVMLTGFVDKAQINWSQ